MDWVEYFQKSIANHGHETGHDKITSFLSKDKAMKKHHKFSHTIVEHHDDGGHSIHHVHEKHGFQGPAKREGDVKGVAGDHDGMMDHIMDHTSAPNPGEANNEANQPIVPPGTAGAPVVPGA
jgi:hypothetical protein